MRKRIFDIVEKSGRSDSVSTAYDILMFICIILSIIPLMYTKYNVFFKTIETVTVIIFIIDYLMRWCTADYKLHGKWYDFLIYPFTPMAIIDMLSILPVLNLINSGFKVMRMTRLFKILRLFKFIRYTDGLVTLRNVIRKEWKILSSVLILALFYVFLTALIMFNVEPHINPETGEETFATFFDALYWSAITLTTVGYGDLCPVTDLGRCVSIVSSILGIAIIALPSGVITASYLDELRHKDHGNTKSTEGESDSLR